jgi:hypothetical protein
VKTVGDDCVPTEHETFTGNVNPKLQAAPKKPGKPGFRRLSEKAR